MKKYLQLMCFLLAVALITACMPAEKTSTAVPAPAVPNPASEASPPVQPESPALPQQPKQEISIEVQELLAKNKNKVKNIYYKYRGPQTAINFYEFFVKGDKIKYLPYLEIKTLDRQESYDSIFIDKSAKTAQSYCKAASCAYKGKKADLNYQETYIPTIFDWISSITQAKKVGEELIDDRSTWKVETNQGTFWIETFYGIPLKIDSGGKIFRFEQIAVNSVQDSDVNP